MTAGSTFVGVAATASRWDCDLPIGEVRATLILACDLGSLPLPAIADMLNTRFADLTRSELVVRRCAMLL